MHMSNDRLKLLYISPPDNSIRFCWVIDRSLTAWRPVVTVELMASHMPRCRFSFLMLAVFLLSGDGLAAVKSEVLEGFEQFTASSKAVSGKFAIVEGKPGVTQGQQALQLKHDASVTISVKTSDFAKMPWLKIDVFVEDKESPSP